MVEGGGRESDPLLLQKKESSANDVALAVEPTGLAVVVQPQETYGYFLILLSCLFYAVMWAGIRYVTAYRGIAVPTMILLRGSTQIVLGLVWTFSILDYKRVFVLPWPLLRLVILRGALGSIAMASHFNAVHLIPVGVATTLFFTNPIWTILLSHFTLGERIGKHEILATVLSFGGVVLVADPWNEQSLVASKMNALGFALALFAACMAAGAYTTLRSVAPQVSFMSNVMSLGVFATMAGVALGGVSVHELTRDPRGIAFAVVASVCGFLGQCCVSEAYRYCRAGTGALMRNLDLPLVYIAGLWVLHEVPKLFAVLGSLLVVSGSLLLGLESVKRRESNRR